MSWIEKAQPTPFDNLPLPGLFFLDGDLLARRIGRTWTTGQKYPMIAFPSGKECELWETSDPDAGAIVHIFGEIDLPFRDSRDRAYEQASEIAEACGYLTRKQGEDRLELWGHDTDEHVVVLYDTASGHMLDIQPIPDEARVPLRLPLLTEAIKNYELVIDGAVGDMAAKQQAGMEAARKRADGVNAGILAPEEYGDGQKNQKCYLVLNLR